jgi:CHAD domain-containing protein
MPVALDTRKFARDQAGRLLGRLAFQVNRTTKSFDPAAVHELRGAIRRFVRLLSVFKPCFEGKATRKMRRRLKKIMVLTSEVRQRDIALKVLAKSRLEDAAGLRSKLQSRRKEAARDLASLLQRWLERKSSLKWRAALEAALSGQAEAFRGITIEQTAGEILPGLAANFFRSGNEAAKEKPSAVKWQELRIASKKFRYTLEIFAPLYGPSALRWLEKIRRTQLVLGGINAWTTTEELVSPYKGGAAMAGWLKKGLRKQAREFRQFWRKEFGDVESVRTFTASLGPAAGKKPAGRSLTHSAQRLVRGAKISLPSSR